MRRQYRKIGAQDPEARVPVSALVTAVTREGDKARHFRFIGLYIIFLGAFAITMLLRNATVWSKNSPYYTAEVVKEHSLRYPEFQEVKSGKDFYAWARKTVTTLHEAHSERRSYQVIPVGIVAFRQLRSLTKPCRTEELDVLPRHERAAFDGWCYAQLKTLSNEAPPFGKGPPTPLEGYNVTAEPIFFPTRLRKETYDGVEIAKTPPSLFGINYDFLTPEDEFVEYAYVEEPLNDTLALINWMEHGRWFDNGTRAVAVDTLHYDTLRDHLMQVSVILERTTLHSAETIVIAAHTPILRFGPPLNNFLFLCDICVLFGIMFLVVDQYFAITEMYRRTHSITLSLFTWWNLVTLFLIVAGMVCFGAQMNVWALFDDDSFNDMVDRRENSVIAYGRISKIMDLRAMVRYLSGAAFVCGGLKLLFYLQHFGRLNVISETLTYAVRNLVSLAIILILMLFIYSVAGNVIFGASIYEMRTINECVGFLSRVMTSAEIEDYYRFAEVSRAAAALYFVSFFFLFFIMLLNMVLGMITEAFGAAQEERQRRKRCVVGRDDSLGISSFGKLVKFHLLFMDERLNSNSRFIESSSDLKSASMMAAFNGANAPPPYMRRWKIYRKRRSMLLDLCYALRQCGYDALNYQEFCELGEGLQSRDLLIMFERGWAQNESHGDATEQAADHLREEIVSLEEDFHHWVEQTSPTIHKTMPSFKFKKKRVEAEVDKLKAQASITTIPPEKLGKNAWSRAKKKMRAVSIMGGGPFNPLRNGVPQPAEDGGLQSPLIADQSMGGFPDPFGEEMTYTESMVIDNGEPVDLDVPDMASSALFSVGSTQSIAATVREKHSARRLVPSSNLKKVSRPRKSSFFTDIDKRMAQNDTRQASSTQLIPSASGGVPASQQAVGNAPQQQQWQSVPTDGVKEKKYTVSLPASPDPQQQQQQQQSLLQQQNSGQAPSHVASSSESVLEPSVAQSSILVHDL